MVRTFVSIAYRIERFLLVFGLVVACFASDISGGWISALFGSPGPDLNSSSVKLLYGESHGISISDLSVTDRFPSPLKENNLDVFGLDYHFNLGTIYFSGRGKIWSLKLNETKERRAIVEDAAGASSVAVDWVQDTVYWTDPGARIVERVTLEGGDRRTIIQDTGDIDRINNLVLDPYQRLIFLAIEGTGYLRADLDGEDVTIVKVKGDEYLREVTLSIDIENRKLYISNRIDLVPHIYSCNYDGSQVTELLLAEQWYDTFVSIGVFQSELLFWVTHVSHERDSVYKAALEDPNNVTSTLEYLADDETNTRIWALKVFHPDMQMSPTVDGERIEKSSDELEKGGEISDETKLQEQLPMSSLSQPCSLASVYLLTFTILYTIFLHYT